MLNKEEILKKLKDMRPDLVERYRVKEIGLFGSIVRREQRAGSDIDLLVEFDTEADLFDWIGLSLYLEEVFGCSVDVVPRKALREELREAVLGQVVKV
ncbi:MAG: nucleotidyltransferase [Caldilineae bacterium]|nr:MAG: nucleotidyltransferase [Caldilineae bacterium]